MREVNLSHLFLLTKLTATIYILFMKLFILLILLTVFIGWKGFDGITSSANPFHTIKTTNFSLLPEDDTLQAEPLMLGGSAFGLDKVTERANLSRGEKWNAFRKLRLANDYG